MMAAVVGLAGCGQHTDCSTGGFGSHGLSNRGVTGSACGSGGGVGSGNGGGPSAFTALAYDINQAGTVDGIGLTVSSGSGTLQTIPNFTAPTIPTGDPGVGMVVAQQKFVYAVFEVEQEIDGWSIDATTGALTEITGFPMAVAFTGIPLSVFNHLFVATNPAGTLLFVSEAGNEQIVVYQISTGGALTPVTGSPFSTGIVEAGNLATDSQGRFLYVCEDPLDDHTGALMTAFVIQSDGSLTAVPNTPFNFPMWEVQGDASGNFMIGTSGNSVFVSNVDDDNLYVFSINQQTGELTAVQGSPFATQFSPFFIASQPNINGNSFVYSFSFNGGGYNAVEGYALNTTSGALTALSGSPFSNLSTSIWGQFDQSGAYLFTYSNINASPELGVLNVDSAGALTEPASTFPLGPSGYWVVTDPPSN